MTSLFDIQGRKAIVTGATRGLGWGMAEGLMEAGAEVVIWGSSEKVNDVAREFQDRGFACHGVTANLTDRASLRAGFARSLELLGGKIDILVNCAGIQRRHPSEEFPMEDWDAVLEVNLTAPFELCQLAGREMLKEGYGKIINIASMQSFFGGFTIPAYASAKGGIALLTKALCNEWAGRGINVNAIAPGYMATEMNTALLDRAAHDRDRYFNLYLVAIGKPAFDGRNGNIVDNFPREIQRVLEVNEFGQVDYTTLNLICNVEEGQEIGRMTVTAGGQTLKVIPLVADRGVARLTYWQILQRCLKMAFMGG